jgi:hypothetical protein
LVISLAINTLNKRNFLCAVHVPAYLYQQDEFL